MSNYEAAGWSMEKFVEDYTKFAEDWAARKDLLHFKKDIKYKGTENKVSW
jgi:hypothetical protein